MLENCSDDFMIKELAPTGPERVSERVGVAGDNTEIVPVMKVLWQLKSDGKWHRCLNLRVRDYNIIILYCVDYKNLSKQKCNKIKVHIFIFALFSVHSQYIGATRDTHKYSGRKNK